MSESNYESLSKRNTDALKINRTLSSSKRKYEETE